MIGRMGRVPSRSSVLLPAVLLVCLFASTPALAKTYSAERYDSVVRLAPDGVLDVTETVVFRFESGVRRASRWRAYRRHLAAVAQGKGPLPGMPAGAVLPFAVSLGLAASWSNYLRRQGLPAPAWFHAVDAASAVTFPAVVAAGGASTSGGGGSAAGAGGGASGAG